MNVEMVLVTLFVALLSFGAGAYSFRREVVVERVVEVPVAVTHAAAPGPTLSPDVPHEHEYDHISGGGKYPGRWRCGLCNDPKPEEEAA